MIRLKELNREDFSALLFKSSFSVISKSVSFKVWGERILQCRNNQNTYLIEYLYDEDIFLSFLVRSDTDSVMYNQSQTLPKETLNNISKGAVLKLWLQLKKKYCLHSSGIRIGEEVILFIGPKGAGKSTTAAYFSTRGYPIWCDDYCILDQNEDAFYALPGETQVKIKDDTVRGLLITTEHLKPLFPTIPGFESALAPENELKFCYGNPTDTIAEQHPLRVKAIFILKERGVGKELICPVDKMEALKAVMGEIMLREIVSKNYLGYYFQETKKLLDEVSVYKIQAADDLGQINLLFESILHQIAYESNHQE